MPRLGIPLSKGKDNCHLTGCSTLFAKMASIILLCIVFTNLCLGIFQIFPSRNRGYLPTGWIRAGLVSCFGQCNVVKVTTWNFDSSPQRLCSTSAHFLRIIASIGEQVQASLLKEKRPCRTKPCQLAFLSQCPRYARCLGHDQQSSSSVDERCVRAKPWMESSLNFQPTEPKMNKCVVWRLSFRVVCYPSIINLYAT